MFDPATGRLARIGDLPVEGPRLDLWRAPTDNDHGLHGEEALEPLWRRVGLHRLQHRIDQVALEGDKLVVRGRVGPAATDLGMATTYRWSAVPGGLWLEVQVVPEADWPCPLPRLGLRMAVPAGLRRVEWFGRGPGRRTPTPGGRPGSGASPPPWRSCRRRISAPGERQPPRRPLGDNRRRPRDRDPAGGGADLRPHRPTLDQRAPRPGPPPDRPAPRRPRLGQPRPRPTGHRLGLLRPRRPPRLPARPGPATFAVRLLPAPA